jgi:hypothetical protein
MNYKVTQVIQSKETPDQPVNDVQFYRGSSLVQAMEALVMAAADFESETVWYTVLQVRLDIVDMF